MRSSDLLRTRIAELASVTDDELGALVRADAREDLLASIVATPIESPERERRHRHRIPVIAAASATTVVAGAAIGWAITSSGATDTVSIQCEINGADTIIPASSGDPVTDCAAQWQRETGTTAPQLIAYDNGHGGITVAPATQTPPPSSSPLPAGSTQNVSAITLQESLDDYIAGLPSSCHSTDAAVAFVRQELQAAGLSDWTVSPPSNSADGAANCANIAIVKAKSQTVLLRALGGPTPSDLPFMKLAHRLRQLSGCESADALARQVQAAATDAGLSEAAHQYQLTTVRNADKCAVVHETVGGTIFLTVRGPRS